VIAFTIPMEPVGKNDLHRRRKGGAVYKTDAARRFHEAVAAFGLKARRSAGLAIIDNPVEVEIRVFFASERPDGDGPVQIVLDALQLSRASTNPAACRTGAGIYRNDRQVVRYMVERGIDRKRPRVEVRIAPAGELFDLGTLLRGAQSAWEAAHEPAPPLRAGKDEEAPA